MFNQKLHINHNFSSAPHGTGPRTGQLRTAGRGPGPDGTGRGGAILASVLETAQVILFSLAIVLVVRAYLIQPFLVKGASMEPNFQDGNYLIIDEISYRLRQPERGEVVVFKYPRDPKQYFIKRIVGLPKERIEIKDQKIKIYNGEFPEGKELDESYLEKESITKGNITVQLGAQEYFVLGDNRQQSSDSRFWGPLPKEFIIGRTWLRAWPLDEISIFK
ncbi:MAG: signal peptidase I [Candidatus Moranbacteria bacterium]|nr:signal peptidase I [Candidatus Moranbacteria bacterium]